MPLKFSVYCLTRFLVSRFPWVRGRPSARVRTRENYGRLETIINICFRRRFSGRCLKKKKKCKKKNEISRESNKQNSSRKRFRSAKNIYCSYYRTEPRGPALGCSHCVFRSLTKIKSGIDRVHRSI